MDRHVDFWNLMAYDFTGSWTTETGHKANLYLSEQSPTSTPFNTEAAVEYYVTTAGIAANKINLGMPLYGRTFGNTAGPGSPYKGVGNTFDWEPGTWDYKVTDSLNNTDGNGMDKTQNVLDYPSSQYDNLRNGFPG
ncbi:hypothetical protein KCV03_g10064, partial [Aureobasidium melanogenum]